MAHGLKECAVRELSDPYDRACAKIARIARGDTYFGGARALVLAERMERRRGSRVPANEIVSWVYSHSNLSCGEWGGYRCPECGGAWLSTEQAYACCSERFEETE